MSQDSSSSLSIAYHLHASNKYHNNDLARHDPHTPQPCSSLIWKELAAAEREGMAGEISLITFQSHMNWVAGRSVSNSQNESTS